MLYPNWMRFEVPDNFGTRTAEDIGYIDPRIALSE